MSRRRWLLLTVIVFAVVASAHGLAAGIAAIIVFPGIIPYGIWCLLSPRTRHGRCSGSGEIRSRLFPWAFRRCRTCINGRVIRLGTLILAAIGLAPARYGREHAAMVQSRREARRAGAWR